MHLEGSCHCGAVRFSLESREPMPYMRCYCSICRKTGGGGGYAINLGGSADTLKVQGDAAVRVYQARLPDGDLSPARRHFCGTCGSALWAFDPRWPELVHPFASAIDTELPVPPTSCHIMLGSKASWVPVETASGDETFDAYPDRSLHDWHKDHGLLS